MFTHLGDACEMERACMFVNFDLIAVRLDCLFVSLSLRALRLIQTCLGFYGKVKRGNATDLLRRLLALLYSV